MNEENNENNVGKNDSNEQHNNINEGNAANNTSDADDQNNNEAAQFRGVGRHLNYRQRIARKMRQEENVVAEEEKHQENHRRRHRSSRLQREEPPLPQDLTPPLARRGSRGLISQPTRSSSSGTSRTAGSEGNSGRNVGSSEGSLLALKLGAEEMRNHSEKNKELPPDDDDDDDDDDDEFEDLEDLVQQKKKSGGGGKKEEFEDLEQGGAPPPEEQGDPTQEEGEEDEMRPGAYQARGRAFGQIPVWGRGRFTRSRQQAGNAASSNTASNAGAAANPAASTPSGESDVIEASPVTDALPIVYPKQVLTQDDMDLEQVKKRRKRKRLIVGGVLLVVVVGVAGGLMGYYIPKGNDGPAEPDTCANVGSTSPGWKQCRCNQEISSVEELSDDEVASFNDTSSKLNFFATLEQDTLSCEPHNFALWWLAKDALNRNNDTANQEEDATATQEEKEEIELQTLIQRYILSLLYIVTDGWNWIEQDFWLETGAECGWEGVECSHERGDNEKDNRVLKLNLPNMNLVGSMPTEIGVLTDLKILNLANNKITGTVPASLFMNLENLRHIDLSNNQLNGTIPEFVNFTNVTKEFLDRNSSDLLDRTRVRDVFHFDVSDNNFTGTIPKTIGFISNMRVFRASNNKLTGTLGPPGMEIVGQTIPDDFFSKLGELLDDFFSELEEIDVSYNQLEGPAVPPEIGLLEDLEIINVAYNKIGSIPTEIALLEELHTLVLAGNPITGTVPANITKLKQLETLDLRDTMLSGTLPDGFCDELVLLNDFWIDCNGTLAQDCTCCGCHDDFS